MAEIVSNLQSALKCAFIPTKDEDLDTLLSNNEEKDFDISKTIFKDNIDIFNITAEQSKELNLAS